MIERVVFTFFFSRGSRGGTIPPRSFDGGEVGGSVLLLWLSVTPRS